MQLGQTVEGRLRAPPFFERRPYAFRMARAIPALSLGLALALHALTAGAQGNPLARHRSVSPPDCVDVSSMTVQYEPAPLDRTYMRVQHMGDPGTAELESQVANVITWDAGTFTGMSVPPESQRGYIDAAPHNVFQLRCGEAGFFIDTVTFRHTVALVGNGPNVSIARDFAQPVAAFARGDALVIAADVRVPWARTRVPPVGEGTAQVGFFVYLRDRTTGRVVAQLVGVFDLRPAGTNGSGVEGLGDDGFNAFVSSPLAAIDGLGRPVRFATASPSSAQMRFVDGWTQELHFEAMVTTANFAAAMAQLRGNGLAVSPDPADYDVLSFGIGGEVVPGTGTDHEVALGASVRNLSLGILPLPRFARP
jgi:hypothetical protein